MMRNITVLFTGALITVMLLFGGTAARGQECPATCRLNHTYFTQVSYDHAMTEFVTGHSQSGYPSTSVESGFMLYSLSLTTEQIADVAAAQAAGCPVDVSYWTRGQLLRSGKAEVGYSATVVTRVVSPMEEITLNTYDIVVTGPPTPNGNYPVENIVPLVAPLTEGDSLTVEALPSAFAFALDTSSRDYGSAYLKMYQTGASGSPVLRMCVP